MERKQTEKLWREEKYRVMFHSQKHYQLIRHAMRDQLPHAEVAQLITDALLQTPTTGSMQNACQHMWGYFRKVAESEEKLTYAQLIEAKDYTELLYFLSKLAMKYEVRYLVESRILPPEPPIDSWVRNGCTSVSRFSNARNIKTTAF